MPIAVNGPNGIVVNFPDGTDTATIDGAMRKQFGGDPTAPAMSTADTAKDVAASGGIGIVKGGMGLAGLPGDLRTLASNATDYVGDKLGVKPETVKAFKESYARFNPTASNVPTSAELRSGLERFTGPLYEPKTGMGHAAQTVGEFAPAALAGPGGIGRRLLTQALIPAAGSEAGGKMAEGTAAEPYAKVAGALLAPIGAKAAGVAAAPFTNPVMSRVAPERFVDSKLAQIYARSGQTPQQVAADLTQAGAEGQGMYTVADALGNSGQRALSGVARTPTPERQAIADALDARQAGQGRRISSALTEGFAAPDTALQREATLTAGRSAAADAAYPLVRQNAGPVDVTGAINRIDQTLAPGVNRLAQPGTNIAPDSVEAALGNIRNRLTDGRSQLTDFESLQRVRGDLADSIETATRAGQGNKVRLLTQVRNEMDRSMEAASPGFRAANADFAARSRAIEAVDTGRTAAQRGRPEDTIPAFNASAPAEQSAFRAGYADPLIAQAQGSATGVNKARPLINDATAAEFPAFAAHQLSPAFLQAAVRQRPDLTNEIHQFWNLTQAAVRQRPEFMDVLRQHLPQMVESRAPLLQRRLGREQRMFETRGAAQGGSKTADNLADSADVTHLDPTALMHLLHGNILAAGSGALSTALRNTLGMSPQVAERLGRELMNTNAQQALTRATAAQIAHAPYLWRSAAGRTAARAAFAEGDAQPSPQPLRITINRNTPTLADVLASQSPH